MKRFAALVLIFALLLSGVSNVYAYDEEEFQSALLDAESLPKALDYTVDFDFCLNEEGFGITRESAVRYIIIALGIDHDDRCMYDYYIYGGFRYFEMPYYPYPFRGYEVNNYENNAEIAFELGIIYGDGDGSFDQWRLLTCAEAAALVMRCIDGDEEKAALDIMFERAKEKGIIKPDDRFYNTPDDFISAEEYMILLYRMRQHRLNAAPVTVSLTNRYLLYKNSIADKEVFGKPMLELVWNTKPVRRGFLYPVMLEKYTFDKINADDVISLFGDYKMERSDKKLSYETYVLDGEIEKEETRNIISDEDGDYKKDYKATYISAAVEFELDENGNIIGEPKLVKKSGGFTKIDTTISIMRNYISKRSYSFKTVWFD